MANGVSAGLRARVSLEKNGFSCTKSLGQNFLLDDDFLEEIVHLSGAGEGDCVLEIGPGPGVMTWHLANNCRKVLSIEIDQKLKPVLADVLEGVENSEIVFEDALKCNLQQLLSDRFSGEKLRVVANLPYYITADAIERLLTCGVEFESITIMVQKEAAEHICAPIGSKSYGALAMLVQYFCDVETLMDVPPERFTPPPHIMSRLIRLTKRGEGRWAQNERVLLRLIKSAFRMRRKTLVNNMMGDFHISREQAEALLENQGLDARIRGEALNIEQVAQLADALQEIIT